MRVACSPRAGAGGRWRLLVWVGGRRRGAAAAAPAAGGGFSFGGGAGASAPKPFGSGGGSAPAAASGFGGGGSSATPFGGGGGGASATPFGGGGGAATGGGFTFTPAAGAPTGFSFSGGGASGGAAPVPFGSKNAALYEKDDLSLQTKADVEPIAEALKRQAFEKVKLFGAPVDCEETPTVSDKAAPALAEALQVCKGSLSWCSWAATASRAPRREHGGEGAMRLRSSVSST